MIDNLTLAKDKAEEELRLARIEINNYKDGK
jgi:hypothetical protein